MLETEVLVTGAGPTGLTCALDLAQRGIKVTLIERHEKPLYLPKMERTNPRSMEIYRRLGMADRIRAAAYPADVAMDIFIGTSLAEAPLAATSCRPVAVLRKTAASVSVRPATWKSRPRR